jgi:ribosomal protein S1
VLLHQSVWLRIRQLQVGQIVSSTIRGVRDYGVLVDIGDLLALLPASKIHYSSVENFSEIFKVNAHLEAMIVEVEDIPRGRIILEAFENSA